MYHCIVSLPGLSHLPTPRDRLIFWTFFPIIYRKPIEPKLILYQNISVVWFVFRFGLKFNSIYSHLQIITTQTPSNFVNTQIFPHRNTQLIFPHTIALSWHHFASSYDRWRSPSSILNLSVINIIHKGNDLDDNTGDACRLWSRLQLRLQEIVTHQYNGMHLGDS